MDVTAHLRKKLEHLRFGMQQMQQNISAQAGAIQAVETLIAEIEAAEAAEATAADKAADVDAAPTE